MTPEFMDFVERFGLPVSMLVTVLLTGLRRMWVWGWALEGEREDRVRERAEWERRLKAAEDREREWRGLFLASLRVGDQSAALNEHLAGRLSP